MWNHPRFSGPLGGWRPILALLALLLCGTGARATEAEVRTAVETYFSVWSQGDMTAYAATFHPEAVIIFTKPDGTVGMRAPVQPFVASQKEAHAVSADPMTEVPLDIKISLDGSLATALVPWKLTAGNRVDTGVDAFTFVRTAAGWKIITLVFNSDEKPRK